MSGRITQIVVSATTGRIRPANRLRWTAIAPTAEPPSSQSNCVFPDTSTDAVVQPDNRRGWARRGPPWLAVQETDGVFL